MKQLIILLFTMNVVIIDSPDDIRICTVSGTGDNQIVICE